MGGIDALHHPDARRRERDLYDSHHHRSETGGTLAVITGTGAGNAGDIFTIAGVFRVHPETKVNSGVLQQFVLTGSLRRRRRQHEHQPAINAVSAARSKTWSCPAQTPRRR